MRNIFSLKLRKKARGSDLSKLQIAYDIVGMPKFDYYDNPEQIFIENSDGLHCICCGKISRYLYNGPFYAADLDVDEDPLFCPECIKSGEAATKFHGEFTPIDNIAPCKNVDAMREVAHKTPSYNSFQEAYWPSCCEIPCAFVGNFAWYEIEENFSDYIDEIIEAVKSNETFIDVGRPIEEFIEAVNCCCAGLYLFQCPRCGKYKVHIDLD